MVPRTGRIRVPLAAAEENNEEPGHIVHLPAIANDFTHPDPPAILEVVVEEVSGTSLQEELEVVVKKIKDTVETDDITSKKVNKLGSEIKYLKTAVVLTEQFEQYFK